MGIFDFFKSNKDLKHVRKTSLVPSAQDQLSNLYKRLDYKAIPELPNNDESRKILEEYQSFPAALIPKAYMTPLPNGLLRGDIVLLWWLTLSKDQNKAPGYFIYDYGIDVSKEMTVLKESKLIRDDRTLTRFGKLTLDENNQIIREHKAVKSISLDGKITYQFKDADRVSKDKRQKSQNGKYSFRSSGDLVEDQNIGHSYEKMNDYTNALLAYKSAFILSLKDPDFPEPPPNIFNRQVIIYRKLKMYDEEIKACDTALKYYPENEFFEDHKRKALFLKEKKR